MEDAKKSEDLLNLLADTFTTDGIVGKRIGYVIDHEKAYGAFVEKTYKGHSILSHAFQEFYMDTLEAAASVWQQQDHRPTPQTYSESWLWHLANFRSIRAIDNMFHNGYPMDGFARLRHLKEAAIFLGAMLSGLTTYFRIKGWEGIIVSGKAIRSEDMDVVRKNRKREEKRILGLMIRNKSGLPSDDLDLLNKWEGFFNEEVHGAFLTQVFEHGPALKGEDTTSVAPKPRELSCSMFMNRFCEIAWMLHRTLPIMQLTTRRFDDGWAMKWKLLDDNFLMMEQSVAELGKTIGNVFIRFIQTKFPFDSRVCFDSHVKL